METAINIGSVNHKSSNLVYYFIYAIFLQFASTGHEADL
ncbi:hypothetical protein A2U01_0087305, partial [Trifolium medium]|nr:hypothetical protein [Trifolium medium]